MPVKHKLSLNRNSELHNRFTLSYKIFIGFHMLLFGIHLIQIEHQIVGCTLFGSRR